MKTEYDIKNELALRSQDDQQLCCTILYKKIIIYYNVII